MTRAAGAEFVVELLDAGSGGWIGLRSLLVGRAQHHAATEGDSVAHEVEASAVPVWPGSADRYPVGGLAFADHLIQPMARFPIR